MSDEARASRRLRQLTPWHRHKERVGQEELGVSGVVAFEPQTWLALRSDRGDVTVDEQLRGKLESQRSVEQRRRMDDAMRSG